MGTIANFIGFQAGWFACVLGAAYGYLWLGPLAVAGLAVFNLKGLPPACRKRELRLLASVSLLGLVLDSLLALSGVFTFLDRQFPPWLSRPWMVALWANFALTLRASMQWLQERYVLGGLLGMVSGPLAYWAGARLGAVELHGVYSLLMLAAAWSATVPFLLWLSAVPQSRPGEEK
ncbi:MAG TPA: DUF2878 domain-containing protein [Acidobacteriota bacterium]|nr:DUF2878 domain-containing protein [Acidobacteriota bacterium]